MRTALQKALPLQAIWKKVGRGLVDRAGDGEGVERDLAGAGAGVLWLPMLRVCSMSKLYSLTSNSAPATRYRTVLEASRFLVLAEVDLGFGDQPGAGGSGAGRTAGRPCIESIAIVVYSFDDRCEVG